MFVREIFVEYEKNGHSERISATTYDGNVAFSGPGLSCHATYEDERLTVKLNPSVPVKIKKAWVKGNIQTPLSDDVRYFLNGFNSWTDSREYSCSDKEKGIGYLPRVLQKKYALNAYGDYDFCGKRLPKGSFHGWTYGYVRKGSEFEFVGSLTERTNAFALIKFFSKTNKFQIFFDAEDVNYEIDSEIDIFDLVFIFGDEEKVFDKYFEILGTPKPKSKPVVGWTSWYNYYQDIDEKILNENLDALIEANKSSEEGFLQGDKSAFKVFQIDDGYQTAVGDWLSIDKNKFPNGLSQITTKAMHNGIKVGIWLAPFSAAVDSEIAKNHPDWLCCDENEQPVLCGCNWGGFYALDIYNNAVRDYIKGVCRTIIDHWGFKFLKIDFLYAACFVPHKNKTRGQVMRDALMFFRKVSSGAELLGCGVPLGSAFGLVDYCRIGTDVSLSWNDKLYMQFCHRERPSTKNTILNSLYRRQLDGRAFLNDPDVFLLRTENEKLGLQRKTLLSKINALCGSLLFTSDNPKKYSATQNELLGEVMKLRNAKITGVTDEKDIVTVKYVLSDAESEAEKELRFNRKNGKTE